MKTKIPAVEKLTVGLDLGDRRHHACVLDASGEILDEEAIVNTREVLAAFCARYPGATVSLDDRRTAFLDPRTAARRGRVRKRLGVKPLHPGPSR